MPSKPSTSRPSVPRESNSKLELSLGDLNGLDPQLSTPNLSHELGKFDELADFDNAKSHVGDLAILDEAISDLDSPVGETRIPTLVESISHATAIHEAIKLAQEQKRAAASESEIPLLNEIATEFKHSAEPLANEDDAIAAALRELETGGVYTADKPASLAQKSEISGEKPFLVDVLSPPLSDVLSSPSVAKSRPSVSRASALEIPPLEPESLDDLLPGSLEQTISNTAKTDTRTHSFESDILAALEDRSDLSMAATNEASVATKLGREHASTASEFHFALPDELHAQLAQKIDQLVIETTTSITNAFSKELNNRLEDILGQAVQTTMANFADSLAENLRTEVKRRVKTQIPEIINDVLGRTKLDK